MKVVDLLRNSSVLIQPTLHAQCADDALTELAAFLAEHHPEVTPAEVAEALAARERLGSTAVGDGLAIPHAKLASAETLMACFGRSETGIRFAAPDGRPTRFFFVLIAPQSAPGEHLAALARVTRLFKSPRLRDRLDRARTREEIFAAMAAEEAS